MIEDHTSKARLRDAAISLVAEGSPLTARSVADRAGVTPGLIRHHFGSMAELVRHCDVHVAALVRRAKEDAIADVASVDVLQALRETGQAHILGYLSRRLTQRSVEIDALVDLMADDAASYLQASVEQGLLRPVDDVSRLAKMLTVYALGSLVLHDHLERLLGVDVTSADLAAEPGIAGYLAVQYDVFSGLLPPVAAEMLKNHTSQGTHDE
jgi:AcrR family transcriptional regulator